MGIAKMGDASRLREYYRVCYGTGIIGLTLATVSGVLLTAPVALSSIVTTIAGYIATAGLVAIAVSQVTVQGK
ncbi:MAG TPA: hypothetical protein VJ647_02340 [Chitinophagaceae bacterium]|nr:hypothetical protein [Chitinophagaceae bacterium]